MRKADGSYCNQNIHTCISTTLQWLHATPPSLCHSNGSIKSQWLLLVQKLRDIILHRKMSNKRQLTLEDFVAPKTKRVCSETSSSSIQSKANKLFKMKMIRKESSQSITLRWHQWWRQCQGLSVIFGYVKLSKLKLLVIFYELIKNRII